MGKSGVGKREVGLELIAKGNKFIADDKVIIKRKYNDKKLRGYCTEIPYLDQSHLFRACCTKSK